MTIGVFVDGKIVQRPYSVASAPGEAGDTGYEFYLRLVAGRDVHADPVGPAGRPPDADDRARRASSCSSPTTTGRTCSSAPGTGNAPFVSMMRDTLAAGRPRRAIYLNGVSHARDLGYRDTRRALGRRPASTRSRSSRRSRDPTTR